MLRKIPLFMVLIGLVSCSQSGPEERDSYDVDQAVAEIEGVTPLFDEYFATKNAEGLAGLFAPDGIRMPPNQPILSGREAIREAMEQVFLNDSIQTANKVTDVTLSGDLAVATGTFTTSIQTADDSPPTNEVGKWMAAFRRQEDGSWKMISNMWNSDLPPVCDPTTQ